MKYLELRVEGKVTEQDLVRWTGLVTVATALVLFPWRRRTRTMLLGKTGRGKKRRHVLASQQINTMTGTQKVTIYDLYLNNIK